MRVELDAQMRAPIAAILPRLLAARDRLAVWLRGDHVQATAGPELGGVAGLIDAAGEPEFFYGEITGYWLRWSSLYAPDATRMRRAVDWLARQWTGPAPAPTRAGAPGDWRNRAVFSFDLGMILQGLTDAAAIVGDAPCRAVARRIVPWLERMIGQDGVLQPCLPLDAELPARWSSRRGSFQMKTAACLLATPEGWLPEHIRNAAKKTLDHWRGHALDHIELHARFYGFEGLLRTTGELDSALWRSIAPAAGALPELDGQRGSLPRSDVEAQALRLLCLMPDGDDAVLTEVASVLLAHIPVDGAIRFRLGDIGSNVWCGIFAHQALDWLCGRFGGEALRPAAAGDLI